MLLLNELLFYENTVIWVVSLQSVLDIVSLSEVLNLSDLVLFFVVVGDIVKDISLFLSIYYALNITI